MRVTSSNASRRRGAARWALVVHPMPASLDPKGAQEFALILDQENDAVVGLHTVKRPCPPETLWQHVAQALEKTLPHRHPSRLSVYPPSLLPQIEAAARERRSGLELQALDSIPASVRLLLELPAEEEAEAPAAPPPPPSTRPTAPAVAPPPPPTPARGEVRAIVELPRYELGMLRSYPSSAAICGVAVAKLAPSLVDADMWDATDLDAEAILAEEHLVGFTLTCVQPEETLEPLLRVEEIAWFDSGTEAGDVTVLVAFSAGRLLGALATAPRGWLGDAERAGLQHAVEWLEGACLLVLARAGGGASVAHPVRVRGDFEPGAHLRVLEPAARLLVRRRSRRADDEG